MQDNTPQTTAETVPVQEKTEQVQNQVDTNQSQVSTEKKVENEGDGENPNWKAFREARKLDRAAREAAEKRAAEKDAEASALKAAMEAAFARGTPQQQSGYDQRSTYESTETEDERIEKKVQYAIAQREAAAEKARAEREAIEYPQRLQKNHPDFNAVVSSENLDYLEFHYPEVARPLQRLRDDYDKWSDIYAAVKKLVPNAATAKRESAKANANLAKPRSMSSTGTTQQTEPLSARLTEERRAENWARMQRTLKGVS